MQAHPPLPRSTTLLSRIVLLMALLLMAALSIAGYQWARAAAAKDIYHERLGQLQTEYRDLADQYNQAVAPKPITELLVEDGEISIIIRKADGQTHRVATGYPADREVFVDYVLVDGRLLIRRVFDEVTGPAYGRYIDEDLLEVDWDAHGPLFGKVIYRQFDEGRWIISVTGNGSLDLKRITDDEAYELVSQPSIRDYAPVDIEASDSAQSIGIGDVWRHLFGE